ncbi:glucosamine-6-phosphate deaminase [bacterium]|nr:glucosamine-6-phosphate deaminase [bacterium]
MKVIIKEDKGEVGREAANIACNTIKKSIEEKGEANIIAATGASQFEFFESLTSMHGLDWSKVRMFHLDEYVGISIEHPASFRKYLKERFIDKTGINEYYFLNGDVENLEKEVERLNSIISKYKIDVAFVGIGENGHLAFNDPPADFEEEKPYIVVTLDEKCKKQQMGEGWFKTIDDVPKQAISMSVKQIMKSEMILCTVPDRRKAEAVHLCMDEEISPQYPASILRDHKECYLILDKDSASLLENK